MPRHRRWEAMIRMAHSLRQSAYTGMQEYFDERAEPWRDSERGETFTEREDYLADPLDSSAGLGVSTLSTEEETDAT